MNYETFVGLEIHVELKTESKLFCGCKTLYGSQPNSQCCPICTGMPGALPVMNKKAVELAVKAGLALNCSISKYNSMDRKNYFYPDSPKSYQITQQFNPICRNGYLDIEYDGIKKRIGITRIHLGEDAGKLLHDGDSSKTLIDYNRAGIPLIEIVTEPHINTPEEATAFLEELRLILLYIGVSDVRMQEGSLRCDVNLSIRPAGETELGTRTEMKNLNSFRAVSRAIRHEEERQISLVESGAKVGWETRRWDDRKNRSFTLREEQDLWDYRYFQDPDLTPFIVPDSLVKEIRVNMPELPEAKRARFISEYSLPLYDTRVLVQSKTMTDFFEECLGLYDPERTPKSSKVMSNWLMGEVSRLLKDRNIGLDELGLTPLHLSELQKHIDKGTISGSMAKEILVICCDTGKAPSQVIESKGLAQISDVDELKSVIRLVIDENPGPVEDFRAGKDKALGYMIGQVMRMTGGKANPQLANRLFQAEIQKGR